MYEIPQLFTDNVGQRLSATDLNVLRDNAITLDGWAYRAVPAFRSFLRSYTWGGIPIRVWWGALRYRAGMTTLTLTGEFTRSGSERLDIYVNADPGGAATATVSSSGSWTRAVTLTGYNDGDWIPIEIWFRQPNGLSTATIIITGVYGGPVTVSSSWPGVPTFAGTYDATRLTQLANAEANLFERINAIPLLPTLVRELFWGPNLNTDINGVTRSWQGSFTRHQSQDQILIAGNVTTTNVSETLRVYVGGVERASATYPAGATSQILFQLDPSAYVSVGATAPVELTITANPGQARAVCSQWRIHTVSQVASVGGYPAQSPPTAFSAYPATISAATLNSRLNAIGTMLTNVKNQLDGAATLWNRIPAVRRRDAPYSASETFVTDTKYCTWRFYRKGRRLVVRGQGVKLGFGAKIPSKEKGKEDEYTFSTEQTIVDGDKLQDVTIWLDSIPALYPGTPYYLFGDVRWCGEYLV